MYSIELEGKSLRYNRGYVMKFKTIKEAYEEIKGASDNDFGTKDVIVIRII